MDESSDEDEDEEMEERKQQSTSPAAAATTPWRYQTGEQYFVSDMLLSHTNQFMAELAQQLLEGARHESAAPPAAGSSSSPPRAPLLSGILQGGAFAYVGSEFEGEVQLPHGVANWTTTHHLWNHRTPPRRHLSQADAPYFPLYFHCESHRAGTVNWRMDDVRVVLKTTAAPQGSSVILDASASDALPVYWLCVEPESDNVELFQEVTSAAAAASESGVSAAGSRGGRRQGKVARVSSSKYSIDDLRPRTLRTIESFLRAGVRMRRKKAQVDRRRSLRRAMQSRPQQHQQRMQGLRVSASLQ